MKRSEIYREAARLVAEDEREYSCLAICRAAGGFNRGYAIAQAYAKLFAPTAYTHGYWLQLDGHLRDSKGWRVLALCFAAAIAESRERSK